MAASPSLRLRLRSWSLPKAIATPARALPAESLTLLTTISPMPAASLIRLTERVLPWQLTVEVAPLMSLPSVSRNAAVTAVHRTSALKVMATVSSVPAETSMLDETTPTTVGVVRAMRPWISGVAVRSKAAAEAGLAQSATARIS